MSGSVDTNPEPMTTSQEVSRNTSYFMQGCYWGCGFICAVCLGISLLGSCTIRQVQLGLASEDDPMPEASK